MKNFSLLKDLLDYWDPCPVCKSNSSVQVMCGPDYKIKTINSFKEIVQLVVKLSSLQKAISKLENIITLTINPNNNTFEIKSNNESSMIKDQVNDLYIYLYCSCVCGCSLNTTDIHIDYENKTISNIGIEQEILTLINYDDKYHINIFPLDNVMYASKLTIKNDIIRHGKSISLPYVDFHSLDELSIINKIKMLICFS